MTASPPFLELASFLSDRVVAAKFPLHRLRFRNDRAAASVGLDGLSDVQWLAHFAQFAPLPGNLLEPLAMRYHGHQFGVYNPDLGDGRGFLFAQLRDTRGRWLDLGTKGSGRTPWSRQGDGRLTLKGGVREVLASAFLEALGVNTSKAFSLVETGESLMRGDEPSPTRSSVLVRLSHSHIRFGTFQRLAALGLREEMAALIGHCVHHYFPNAAREDTSAQAAALLDAITRATAGMVASWMAAGFVHGVMNTDNFNLTGEAFDFGPYRFLPRSDPNFVAAYFDHNGLYRFGRQPGQAFWNLQQLASALTLVTGSDTRGLVEALSCYERTYLRALGDAMRGRLGLAAGADGEDLRLVSRLFDWMSAHDVSWQGVFHDWFGGGINAHRALAGPRGALYRGDDFAPVRAMLEARAADRPERLAHELFARPEPVDLLISEIEAIWAPIADGDDWSLFAAKLDELNALREALALSPPDPFQ